MRLMLIAAACAVLLGACGTIYQATPIEAPGVSVSWNGGQAVARSERPQGIVEVRPAGAASRLWFEVGVRNRGAAPVVFGNGNVTAFDAKGKPLRLYSRIELVQEAYSDAGSAQSTINSIISTADSSARVQATSTRDKTIEKDGKTVTVQETVYDAALAETIRQRTLADAARRTSEIQDRLAYEISMLNDGRMLETTTVAPGEVELGQVVAKAPAAAGPDRPMTLQVLLNGEVHAFAFAVAPVQ